MIVVAGQEPGDESGITIDESVDDYPPADQAYKRFSLLLRKVS